MTARDGTLVDARNTLANMPASAFGPSWEARDQMVADMDRILEDISTDVE